MKISVAIRELKQFIKDLQDDDPRCGVSQHWLAVFEG